MDEITKPRIDELVDIKSKNETGLGKLGLQDSNTQIGVQVIGQDRNVSWHWHVLR